MSQTKELKNFQTNLNMDKETKQQFVDKEIEDEHKFEEESISDSSSSEEEEHIKIIAPRKKGKSGLDQLLLEQTISQQKAYLKAQKTISKLRSEIDTEEVKTRYLKLDLNNLQVKLDEEVEKNKEMNKELSKINFENMAFKAFIIFYIFWSIYRRFT